MPFIVTGADRETGEPRTLTLAGPTRHHAEADANRRGILVSDVRYVARHGARRRIGSRVLVPVVVALIAGLAIGYVVGREQMRAQVASSPDAGPPSIGSGIAGIADRLTGFRHRHRQQDVEHAPVPVSLWNQMMLSGVHEITADQMPAPSPRLTPISRAPRAGDQLVVSCDTYFAVGDRYTGPERLAKVLDMLRAKDGVGLLRMQALTHAQPFVAGVPVLVIAVDDDVVELRLDQYRRSGRIAPLETFTLYGVPVQLADDPGR